MMHCVYPHINEDMLLELCFFTLLMWCKGIIQKQQPMSMMSWRKGSQHKMSWMHLEYHTSILVK